METHAPSAMNASAATACRASSRVRMRIRTLVSTARMALYHVLPYTVLQFSESSRFRRSVREQLPMDVLGCKPSGSPNEDLAALLIPLENRSRTNTQLPPDVGGN